MSKQLAGGFIVLTLCGMLNIASAIYVDNGTIMVESSDIVSDQNDDVREGYNFRFKYYPDTTNSDTSHGKYCINDATKLIFSGYTSAIYSQSETRVKEALYYPIIPSKLNTEGWVIWHFDFSDAGSKNDTIDQLQVKMRSETFNKGLAGASIKWQVSRDGLQWNDIFSISSGQYNAEFWDLTYYTKGASEYFLKATLYSTKNLSDAVLFNNNDFGLDNEVWLIPEPLTAMMLVIGVACVLRGRKQGR